MASAEKIHSAAADIDTAQAALSAVKVGLETAEVVVDAVDEARRKTRPLARLGLLLAVIGVVALVVLLVQRRRARGGVTVEAQRESPLPGSPELALASTWPVALFVGLVTTVIGVIVLAWPSQTLTVLSILFGIQLLLFGLFRLISAFSSQTLAPGLVGFVGVVGMLAGVVVLRHPFETVAVLATILGVVWVVGGSIELIASIADRSLSDRGLMAVSAAVSIIFGIIVVVWPAPTVTVIAWIAGLYLILFGLTFCFGAYRLRKLEA